MGASQAIIRRASRVVSLVKSLAEERGEAEIRHRFDPQRSLSWDQVQALLNSEDLMDMRAALEWLLADDGLCCTLAKPKDVLAEKAELPEGAENQPFWEIGEQVEADPDGMCVRVGNGATSPCGEGGLKLRRPCGSHRMPAPFTLSICLREIV